MSESALKSAPELSKLLAPFPLDQFVRLHWERAPLWVKGASDRFAPILSAAAIEGLFAQGELRIPAVLLAKGGAYLAAEAFSRDIKHGGEVTTGVVDVELVKRAYESGATIVLPALHRIHPPLRDLVTRLEREIDHAVHANAYVTPGDATGFTPHYDTHDVLVLQVAGSKRWRVYPSPLPLPHRSQPFTPQAYVEPKEALLDIELAQGDLLYLPRGYVHTAFTSRQASVHATIGITVYTWLDLASELLGAGALLPGMREALPLGFARQPGAVAALREGLEERLREWRSRTDPDAAVASLRAKARERLKEPAFLKVDVRVLRLDTALRLAPGKSYRLGHDVRGVVLQVGGAELVFPDAVRPTLEGMVAGGVFRLEGLPRPAGDDLVLAAARRLEAEGVVLRAERDAIDAGEGRSTFVIGAIEARGE